MDIFIAFKSYIAFDLNVFIFFQREINHELKNKESLVAKKCAVSVWLYFNIRSLFYISRASSNVYLYPKQ